MIAGEALLFLCSCLIGVGFGILYDGFRVLRLFLPSGEKIVFVEDGLFFGIITVVDFLFFLSRTYGELRLFLIIGELLGFLMYYLTAGRAVYFLMLHLSRGIKRLCRKVLDILKTLFGTITQNQSDKTVTNDENPVNHLDS